MFKHLLPSFLLIIVATTLSTAQNQGFAVQYSLPDSLYVCGADTLFVHLKNNGTQPVSGNLSVKLPGGIWYEPGTTAGASEQDISNLAEPLLGVSAVQPGSTLTVSLLITADCLAARGLNAGSLVPCTLGFNGGNVTASVVTSSIALETGLLLI